MSEAEWLASEDPAAMLAWLGDKASDRKLRLFAAACCRRVWRQLTDGRSRAAVEVAERFADGLATADELAAAWDATRTAAWDAAWAAARAVARAVARVAARDAAGAAARAAAWDAARDAARDAAWDAERKAQAAILRDLVGNPFRPVTPPREWLTADVVSLAEAAYEHRLDDGTLDPARLAVLSDALEEAGGVDAPCGVCNGATVGIWAYPCRVCLSSKLLAHLRSPGSHHRGCWALDLLLGKS